MPTEGSVDLGLVDTSVAVPLVLTDHKHHIETVATIADRRLGLAGHAGFETFSVLTRLPHPNRRKPATISALLASNFPHSRFLGAGAAETLLAKLPSLGLAGGATYDALVGAAAAEHDATLLTRDRRALDTYRALGVSVELLG